MTFIEEVRKQAQAKRKKIVLPEGEEIRVIKAADEILREKIAKVILIGRPENIQEQAQNHGFDIKNPDLEIIDWQNIKELEKFKTLEAAFYELKKSSGLTKERAIQTLQDPLYFGVMMVQSKMADGMVGGCTYPTADVLRAVFRILINSKEKKFVSSFFVVQTENKNLGENGTLFFADCAVNPNPTEEQLAQIAIDTANSFEEFMKKESRVAMLSYSTNGSAKGDLVAKVANATRIAREKNPKFKIEGEIQLDAAVILEVSKLKSPKSAIEGRANVLIFPNLEAGNIGYKLVERFGNVKAIGPIMQGIRYPVNDLSRGCNVEDIVNGVAITAVQAQINERA